MTAFDQQSAFYDLQSADVFVIEASPQYQLIATNSLGEHTNSTVVGSQGNLFIRTHEALWCIGE